MKFTLRKVEKEILRMDPGMDKESVVFKRAVLLMAAAILGSNATNDLVEFTGYPLRIVRQHRADAIRAKVWTQKNGFCLSDWSDTETGAISFWLDTLAVDGLIQRCEKGDK